MEFADYPADTAFERSSMLTGLTVCVSSLKPGRKKEREGLCKHTVLSAENGLLKGNRQKTSLWKMKLSK